MPPAPSRVPSAAGRFGVCLRVVESDVPHPSPSWPGLIGWTCASAWTGQTPGGRLVSPSVPLWFTLFEVAETSVVLQPMLVLAPSTPPIRRGLSLALEAERPHPHRPGQCRRPDRGGFGRGSSTET
ncbi:hypothetical protein MTBLM5_50169 [Magnetospirillum sp. LM-5]|nr:hypothetical protein MTBLM5_50169 [Magnetospirillum sp. LM-5]